MCALLIYLTIATPSAIIEPSAFYQDAARLDLWIQSFTSWQSAPWLGIGPSGLSFILTQGTFAHPHNVILQWLAEWGVFASGLLAVLLLWVLYKGFVQLKYDIRQRQHINIIFALIVVEFLAHALVSGVFVMPLSQLLMVFALGAWLAPLLPSINAVFGTQRYTLPARSLVIVAIALWCCYAYLLYTTAVQDDSCSMNQGGHVCGRRVSGYCVE